VWGLVFLIALLAGYVGVVRPARLWVAEHVAYPALAALDTPRAQTLRVVRLPHRPDAVWAIPTRLGGDPAVAVQDHRDEVGEWAAPVGVIFLLPALFLIAAYPDRPYWLWLLAYHVVLGVVSLGVFAVGVGWFEPAFAVYTFSRTYLAEAVSLVVPLLLVLAGGEFGREDAASTAGSGSPAPSGGTPAP
jgi:hypothetical protein